MKQGQATISGPRDQKVEPKSTAINPSWVADIGNLRGSHTMEGDIKNPTTPNMTLGNGYDPKGPNGAVPGWAGEGPGAGRIVRNSGSQGKY
jgi:hypothetical protein